MKRKKYRSYADGPFEIRCLYIRPEQVEYLDYYADLFGISCSAVLDMVIDKSMKESHYNMR